MIRFLFSFGIFLGFTFCKLYDSKEFAKRYFPEGKYIKIQNHEIFVIENHLEKAKSHIPILFIHGFSSNVHTWENVINNFVNSYPIVALDLLGFGFSDKPDVIYSRDNYLKLIADVQNYYEFKKVILIGNSMGGELSLRYTLRYPEKVHKLILINSAGLLEMSQPPYFIKKISIFFLNFTEFLFVNRTMIRYVLSSAFYDDSKITERKIDLYYLPLRTKGGTLAHKGLFLSGYQKISIDDLQNLKTPTMIIWGLNDSWIPLQHAFMFFKYIQNAKLILLPETGHIAQEERAEEVVFYILSFIKEEID